MNRNDNVVAIGDGYSTNEATGAMRYTSSSTGRSYVMKDDHGNETRAPGACLNCGGGHWRRFCPYRRGNSTL